MKKTWTRIFVLASLLSTMAATPLDETKLMASDGAPRDQFGGAVSISGEGAMVGALAVRPEGAAYIFRRDGERWRQEAIILARLYPFCSQASQGQALPG
jgi:hypothetical protein